MCGICGCLKVKRDARQIMEDEIKIMCDMMVHRGPDGGKTWIDDSGQCGFGHRRLSIIDLSDSAKQPMTNEAGDVVVTFNGEIYNHAEIKREIELMCHYKWKTDHSDTEVIIHAYEQWGIHCIERFRGCFAFALWDAKKEKVYLVRDRLGIKPLYYTENDGNVLFASEIKALLPVLKTKAKMNYRALYNYLTFLCVPDEETLFEGIYKVRPATIITISTCGRIIKERYWDVLEKTRTEFKNASDQEIHNAILEELKTAVNYRKISDVPVGIFLSGGIDSSTNCELFTKNTDAAVKTFCIGYKNASEDYFNENNYARMVARHCKTNHFEKLLSEEDWIEFIPEMIRLQDEPIADPTCVPSYYVSKLAKEHGVSVAQVGEGADEIFCGYKLWIKLMHLENYNQKFKWDFPKKYLLSILQNNSKYNTSLYAEVLRRAVEKEPIFWTGAECLYEYDKRRIISRKLLSVVGNDDSFGAIRETYKRFKEVSPEPSVLNWMSYADINVRLPELLLMRVDKMSMGVGLECRVPFLDHKLVELAMSIPSERKIAGGITKRVLKDSVRGIVPDKIINRPKQGFGIPIHSWINRNLGKKMRKSIMDFTEYTDVLDKKAINIVLNNFSANQMWCLYNLSEWWKYYIASG